MNYRDLTRRERDPQGRSILLRMAGCDQRDLSTAIRAAMPAIPFLFTSGTTALVVSLIVSTVAHLFVGASRVFVTGRSRLKSGVEIILVGLGAAAITYALGLFIAPAIG